VGSVFKLSEKEDQRVLNIDLIRISLRADRKRIVQYDKKSIMHPSLRLDKFTPFQRC